MGACLSRMGAFAGWLHHPAHTLTHHENNFLSHKGYQGVTKVIVAVPERSIGSSFAKTDLMLHGFFADWIPNDKYNLCTPGSDNSRSKVKSFHHFMENNEQILICTHATLRFACEELPENMFNDCLLAIDEFHHVSADVKIGRASCRERV